MKPELLLRKKILIPTVAVLVLSSWFCWYVWHWEHRDPLLEVYFFDVVKGSAIFICTPHGKTVLIGGGQGSDIIRKLTAVLPFYRHHIDTLIYSVDPLNAIGLTDVIGRYHFDREIHVATSSSASSTLLSQNIHEMLDEMNGDQVLLDSTNGLLRVSYGSDSFVLLDSMDKKSQQMQQGITGEVVQLRSAASTRVSTTFFEFIHPKYVVVSKTPSRPKPPAPKATSTKAVKIVKAVATSTKKVKKATSPPKPKKISPPKDPPFDIFSYPSVKVFALDQKGTIEFISDGKGLRVISAEK